MRILCFTDPHWCEYSSIVRSNGKTFSTRLENLIDSVNWVLDTAVTEKCDAIVCLGDFFDKEHLNSREITALSKVDFSRVDMPIFFITGNHEMGANDLSYSSSHIFDVVANSTNISCVSTFDWGNTEIVFLPYILERGRKPLEEYIGKKTQGKNRVVLSHNDIKGIQMGAWLSDVGFSVEEIENCCDLFINGHLHNGSAITDKVINLGNLTGQNFSEDATCYSHNIVILDTDTLNLDLVENPYALNFYKIDATKWYTFAGDLQLKSNAVVTMTCDADRYEEAKGMLDRVYGIVAYRVVTVKNPAKHDGDEDSPKFDAVDHIEQFKKYVTENIGTDTITLGELAEVLK